MRRWFSEHALFIRFTILSLVAFAGVSALVLTTIAPVIRAFFVVDAERQAVVVTNRFAAIYLRPEIRRLPESPEAREYFRQFIELLPIRGLVGASVISYDGRVLFSTHPDAAFGGADYTRDDAFRDARQLESSAGFRTLPERDRAVLGVSEVFASFIPITFRDEREATFVVVAFSRTGFINEAIRSTEQAVAYRILAGLAGLYALLSLIVWGASRTIRKQNADLAAGLKREQELSSLKDRFISTASHQLNTPVSVMGWSLELLSDAKATPEKSGKALADITKAFGDLRALVNNLLTVTDIGFHYEQKRVSPVNLSELTAEVVARMAPTAATRGIAISFSSADGDATVLGDAFSLKKVIEHLVDNAVQYSDNRTAVTVTVTPEAKGVRWYIHNTGIGIPPEDQPFMFQEMFRAKNAVERKNVGSGLGLFVAKRVVEGHGGTIAFASSDEAGTAFWFTIPRVKK